MQALLEIAETEILTLAFCFCLVFVAGVAFGYINGVTDRKTAPPKLTPASGFHELNKPRPGTPRMRNPPPPPPKRPLTTSSAEDFEKEYRRDVLGKEEAEEITEALRSIFICPKCFIKINECNCPG